MCYLRLLSASTFRLREPTTFRALRPRFPPVRPTSAASAARTTLAALSCSTFWALCCPDLERTSPTWLAALFAARKLLDRSLQSHTAQRPSSSLQPRLLPGTQPGFDNLSHWLRPLDKTAGSKWYRAYLETVVRGDYLIHRAAFWPPWVFLLRGFSPRMHGSRLQLLAILEVMDFLP
ncbi:hypothetical protein DER44DRAFT_179835 [Fusarium oxysporum]|nr:hypothetical protein DER44DRAFT_179835 [Fusarium oxysporum]